jgi:hypothetical protein
MLGVKDSPRDSVLSYLERGPYSHAVFLTYSLDIPFFESCILRHLAGRGCGNIVVLADAHHVSAELLRLTEPGLSSRSLNLGRYYSLTPVHHTSAFHPKVTLLIGDNVELFVGSGNIEPGGMISNLEFFHRIFCSSVNPNDLEARALVIDAWRYIRNQVATLIPDFVGHQLRQIEQAVPWIKSVEQHAGNTRFVHGPGTDVVRVLKNAVGNDEVQQLYILSPFFDDDLEALKDLQARLQAKRVVLMLQSNTVSVSGKELGRLKGVEIYELGDQTQRYAHAKLVVAECRHRSVMLAGSHNVSQPAFKGRNYEASILRIASDGNRFSNEIGITEALRTSQRADLGQMRVRPRPEDLADKGLRTILVAAQIDGNRLEIESRRPLDNSSRLLPYGRGDKSFRLDISPDVSDGKVVFLLPDASTANDWDAVAVEQKGERTAPVPLLHIQRLCERASPTLHQRIADKIRSGPLDLSGVEELLRDFQMLLFEGRRGGIRPRIHEPKPANSAKDGKIQQLSYEDFVIPWEEAPGHTASFVSQRHDFDMIIRAIAAAIGDTREPPERNTAQDDAVLSEDESLARTSDSLSDTPEDDLRQEPSLAKQIAEAAEPPIGPRGDGQNPATGRKPTDSREADECGGRRLRNLLHRIITGYPRRLKLICEAELPSLEILDQVTSAGHLVTSLLGRKHGKGFGEIELVGWEEWGDFHTNLLEVLSSHENQFLQRIPWASQMFEFHRLKVERFAAYLAIVEALSRHASLEVEHRARIQIGLVRVSRILGIDKGLMRPKAIAELSRRIIGSTSPHLELPDVKWANWVKLVSYLRAEDFRLRKRYTSAKQIAASGHGPANLDVGDWIWWPHTEGHIAVVVALGGSNIEAAYQPLSTKKLCPEYVLKLET